MEKLSEQKLKNNSEGKANGIASTVFGIVGIPVLCFGALGAIITSLTGIIALVEAKVSKKRGYTGKLRIAGKILGIISIILAILIIAISVLAVVFKIGAQYNGSI